jgi:type VII secretion protein EccE
VPGGIIGARPAAAPPPQAPAESLLSTYAAVPPVAGVAAPPQTHARTDTARPQSAQLAQAAAAQRALASASVATITPPTGAGWSNWQASSLAVAPEVEPPTGNPGRPRRPVRPATAWSLHAVQIIAWQLAIVGVLVGIQQPLERMIPLLVGAFVLLAVTIPRFHGRWAYQWLGTWLRFAHRGRRRSFVAGSPISELLRPFLRGLQIGTIEIDETERAVLTHAGGLTVLIEVAPLGNGMFVDAGVTVPPPTDLLPPAEESGAPVSAQIVVQTTPAPGANRAQGIVADSYHALGQGMVPAHRRSWIALQAMRTPLDPGSGDADLRATLINAVARLERRLRRAGMRATVLDGAQLTADLAILSGAATVPQPNGPPVVQVQEQWGFWSAGPHTQITYRLHGWPDLGTHAGREFFDRLATVSTVTTTVGLAARRVARPSGKSVDTSEFELEAVLRLTVPTGQAETLKTQLDDLAARHGVRLQRMNGEHAFGVAASLPLGGFVT